MKNNWWNEKEKEIEDKKNPPKKIQKGEWVQKKKEEKYTHTTLKWENAQLRA